MSIGECVRLALTDRWLLQVGVVCIGICLRGAAFGSSRSSAKGGASGAGAHQLWGLAAMLTSALGYSLLGVLYDLLLSTESPPPTHPEVMQYTSKLGVLRAFLTPHDARRMVRWRTSM